MTSHIGAPQACGNLRQSHQVTSQSHRDTRPLTRRVSIAEQELRAYLLHWHCYLYYRKDHGYHSLVVTRVTGVVRIFRWRKHIAQVRARHFCLTLFRTERA